MPSRDVEVIWERIKAHEGETFYTKKGKIVTYGIKGSSIELQNTSRNIPKSDVKKALEILKNLEVKDPLITVLNKLQGYPYLYGIITDERIIG